MGDNTVEIDTKMKIYSIFVIVALFGLVSLTSADLSRDSEVAKEGFQQRYARNAMDAFMASYCHKCTFCDECNKGIPCEGKYTSEECKDCGQCWEGEEQCKDCLNCAVWDEAKAQYGYSSAPLRAASTCVILSTLLFTF